MNESWVPAVRRLPPELVVLVFERLPSFHDLCECSRVCRGWQPLADAETAWGAMLEQRCVDIEAERKVIADGLSTGAAKNKALFRSWFLRYQGFTESYTRMRRAFQRLEAWARVYSPLVLQSLAPGLGWMRDEQMPVRELLEVVDDSPAIRDFIMAHHIHDGQRRRTQFLDFGLFGSYECYGEFCSLSWLSSRMLQVVAMGKFSILVFAWCHATRNYLGIVVGCPSRHASQLQHHVVQLQPRSFRFVDKGLFGNFFTTYVDELVRGCYDVTDYRISMMPCRGPYASSSVAHGIETTVSSMFCVDETSSFRVYRYQVTFEIVDAEALGYDSVQLESRCWTVHYSNQEYLQTNGSGVVGDFPVISADAPYYRYCSRMQDEPEGIMVVGFEGHFTVVPGLLDAPRGPALTLPVPYVHLPVPLEIL
ncbi:hypothetical protein GGF46_004554 [Coemansia sp. RSA 552]|nr:hypothetical protein GGF46_004554 [Coemansia sp. RSA 552]